MVKKIIYTALLVSLIFQLGCSNPNYKRIIAEENIGAQKEYIVSNSISEQIYLELNDKDIFYPAFYYKGEVFGHIKKINGSYPIERKYLYKVDVNNKLTETIKENINYIPGHNPVGIDGEKVYTIDYRKANKRMQISELSKTMEYLIDKNKESKFEISYVSGSDRYIVINELSNNLNNVYIYDIEEEKFYVIEHDKIHRYGDICYVPYFDTLIWIDQEDYKIYKIQLKNSYYTLEEYIDLDVNKDVNRVRGIMNSNYELILMFDSKIGNNDEWDLMETIEIRSYNLKSNQYVNLFKKPSDENIYIKYLGDYIFIAENFNIFDNYIEITRRRTYYYKYNQMFLVYDEKYIEKSQQLYPEINVVTNVTGSEIFSTREIKEIVNGVPTTKKVIYQRINLIIPIKSSNFNRE